MKYLIMNSNNFKKSEWNVMGSLVLINLAFISLGLKTFVSKFSKNLLIVWVKFSHSVKFDEN